MPSITLDAENPYDLFDSGRGSLFFDSAKAPFDGTEQLHAFHRIQIATSTTSLANCTSFSDITQSATFKFKFAKFRLKLTSGFKAPQFIVSLKVIETSLVGVSTPIP